MKHPQGNVQKENEVINVKVGSSEFKGCVFSFNKRHDSEHEDVFKSEITNCIFELKKGEKNSLFRNTGENETFILKLDGYAIVPADKYLKLEKEYNKVGFFRKLINFIFE